ncbi:HipA domain-containing protein [Aquabacterium sp.]|uniref:HipA domain-containing protein n=1 Tax=Aquabacterium sp. TaxID=1872578 RepID=UPI00198FE223|nr:HipA domain-containing protein [Aquabacterium sp.]MBC7699398.1 HipA domain-containing protein [Aquabacterium sp.]
MKGGEELVAALQSLGSRPVKQEQERQHRAELKACAELVETLAQTSNLFQTYPEVLARLQHWQAHLATPRVLQVLVNEDRVGWLIDLNDIWLFQYDPAWAANPDAFDLSPGLARSQGTHLDGASNRKVQWYFDNLLPEEDLLKVLAKEAQLEFKDAFGLLRYYGAESAGSLVLLPLGSALAETGLVPLTREGLDFRIKNLEKAPLTQGAPKRMSLAGAQHKMVVVATPEGLFEPMPGTPSTHILKPNSPSPHYPNSVVNEYYIMRLAKELGLDVPCVSRVYLPEPAYLIERFDRRVHRLEPKQGVIEVDRMHVIDTCQLFDTSRALKYEEATLATLTEAVCKTRSRAKTRQHLFQWVVFNTLVGNGDNHLKNLSFQVTNKGVEFAPGYDMLCTAVYETQGYSNDSAWPNNAALGLKILSAARFSEVTYGHLVEAGLALGLGRAATIRQLDRLITALEPKARALLEELEAGYGTPAPRDLLAPFHASPETKASERQLLRSIFHVVIRGMAKQVQASKPEASSICVPLRG